MTKKRTAMLSALSHHVPQSEWTKAREAERIKHEPGELEHRDWRTREVYRPKELDYRGRQPRNIIALTGRPLP